MDEQEYEEILIYLTQSKYPESFKSKDSRSNWRKKCRPFTYCKEELYYNHKKYGALLAVKGTKDKKRIIETCHLQSDGHHHGINRTLKKISTNYYWKTIAKDVHRYVKAECQTCIEQTSQQTSNARQGNTSQGTSSKGEKNKSTEKIVDKAIEQIGLDVIGNILDSNVPSPQEQSCNVFKCESGTSQQTVQQSLPLRDHIMIQCGLDVVGPIHETHKGKRFIVVLTDCVTKWVEAMALSEFTTDSIGNFLAEAICRHGSIEEILTKHSHDFCARLTEKLCSMMGITIRMSTILPSQPNGYIEHYWYNSLLCCALIEYSNQNQYYWDMYLRQIILAYNTFHQKNTPGSPFQLLYNRPTRLPILELSQPANDAYNDEQEALLVHITDCIKALSCPTHQQSMCVHNQPHDNRVTPPYMPPNDITTPTPPSTTITTAHHQQSAHTLGSYAQTVQANNQLSNSSLSFTTLGPSIQSTAQNNASVQSIQTNNMTGQTLSTNNMIAHTISANSINTHTIPSNSITTHSIPVSTLTAQTIQANSVNSNRIPNNSLITPNASPAVSHMVTPHVTATQSTTIPTSTQMTTQATTDAHSGHMVMIHTDGKTYADSFYVICPQ